MIISVVCLIVHADVSEGNTITILEPSFQNNLKISINTDNLDIRIISAGLGIHGVLTNNGDIDIYDISLSINTLGGFFIVPSTQDYKISVLQAGESTRFTIKVFGIGLSIITTTPEITITVHSPDICDKELTVIANIVGPFVKILGVYYNDDASFNGYTLFNPEYSTNTYLINNNGTIVHIWQSNYIQGLTVKLLENGDIIRTAYQFNPVFMAGGITGRIERFDWNNTLVWEFAYSNNQQCLHHDFEMLPNGNILMIAWEYKTAAEAIQAGRNPFSLPTGKLWPDHIIEVEASGSSGGDIVWEWHIWDHLIQDYDISKDNYGVVADHPELVDINYGIESGKTSADWNHINAIDYHEEFDQILLSAHNQNEIWVIDHSTTTQEAAGHTGGNSGKGGDILYRWGNPAVYQAGNVDDQKLFGQHDAQWIDPNCPGGGHILIFNNGQGRPEGHYSSVDEIVSPVDSNGTYYLESGCSYGPEESFWSYTAENPFDFYSGNLAGAQRLPNGNTLICNGANGIFLEVTNEKKTVWEYMNVYPNIMNNQVFTITRYAPEYPGLSNLFNISK